MRLCRWVPRSWVTYRFVSWRLPSLPHRRFSLNFIDTSHLRCVPVSPWFQQQMLRETSKRLAEALVRTQKPGSTKREERKTRERFPHWNSIFQGRQGALCAPPSSNRLNKPWPGRSQCQIYSRASVTVTKIIAGTRQFRGKSFTLNSNTKRTSCLCL